MDGNSTNHRGVLAQYLNTNIPGHKILLAHACNNPHCSNPNHLYWATHYENSVEDGIKYGTWMNLHDRTMSKYGAEQAYKIFASGDKSKGGKALKGIPKSEDHKQKISQSLCKRYNRDYVQPEVLIEQILKSNIDFSKLGWVEKVSKILNIAPQKVTKWMKRNMNQFYNESCFKRNKTTPV